MKEAHEDEVSIICITQLQNEIKEFKHQKYNSVLKRKEVIEQEFQKYLSKKDQMFQEK